MQLGLNSYNKTSSPQTSGLFKDVRNGKMFYLIDFLETSNAYRLLVSEMKKIGGHGIV